MHYTNIHLAQGSVRLSIAIPTFVHLLLIHVVLNIGFKSLPDEVRVSEDSEKQSGLMLKILCEQFDLSLEEV